MENKYALITGASQGIGKAMAVALAKKNYNVLLVSRSADQLAQLAKQLKDQYQIQAEFLAIDLSEQEAALKVKNWCTSNSFDVSILINNAGFGLYGQFEKMDIEETSGMLKLNLIALTELTHHFIPLLKRNKNAHILNIASTASYQAIPSMAIYAASKSFVLSFSRALRYELKGQINVSCLCPGPTDTGFVARSGMTSFKNITEKFSADPESVAAAGINGMFGKKAEIIPGFTNKLGAFSTRLFPKWIIESITARLFPSS